MKQSHINEFKRAVRNNAYEVGDEGILLPRQHINLGGVFTHEVIRDGKSLGVQSDHNIVVDEGLDHFLDVALAGATQITSWYIGIFEGNYTPVNTDTAANITANSTESTAYDEATREIWVDDAISSHTIDNQTTRADFTINATKTIYGAFFVSASAKSATTGTLVAASRFAASRAVIALDQLLVSYSFTIADA